MSAKPHRQHQEMDSRRILMLQQVERDMPSVLGVFRRVFEGVASKRDAIKAQCLHCTWLKKEFIRDCAATGCPLWNYRPYQPKT